MIPGFKLELHSTSIGANSESRENGVQATAGVLPNGLPAPSMNSTPREVVAWNWLDNMRAVEGSIEVRSSSPVMTVGIRDGWIRIDARLRGAIDTIAELSVSVDGRKFSVHSQRDFPFDPNVMLTISVQEIVGKLMQKLRDAGFEVEVSSERVEMFLQPNVDYFRFRVG